MLLARHDCSSQPQPGAIEQTTQLLRILGAVLVFAAAATGAVPLIPGTNSALQIHESIDRGRAFLSNLFDPELNLLPEFRGSKTYWLFHDNYLAARTLAKTAPDLSRRVEAALAK